MIDEEVVLVAVPAARLDDDDVGVVLVDGGLQIAEPLRLVASRLWPGPPMARVSIPALTNVASMTGYAWCSSESPISSTFFGDGTAARSGAVPVACTGDVIGGCVTIGDDPASTVAVSTARASARLVTVTAAPAMTTQSTATAPAVNTLSGTRRSRIGRSSATYDTSAMARVTATRTAPSATPSSPVRSWFNHRKIGQWYTYTP